MPTLKISHRRRMALPVIFNINITKPDRLVCSAGRNSICCPCCVAAEADSIVGHTCLKNVYSHRKLIKRLVKQKS